MAPGIQVRQILPSPRTQKHQTEATSESICLPGSADSLKWDMVQKEAATGKGYLHNHKDVHGRPVIVIKSALHKTGQ